MSHSRSRISVLSAAMVAALSALGSLGLGTAAAPIASAATGVAPACGAVLASDDYFLTADIGPCADDDQVLTLDSASLDMRGHVLRGDDGTGHGIVMTGTGSALRNGTVRDTRDGVRLEGVGEHVVSRVTSKSNERDGFSVQSTDNILRANIANDNGNSGFLVEVGTNLLTGNTASRNPDAFVVEDFATDNRVWNNTATRSEGAGFFDEAAGTVYAGNRAIASGGNGFFIGGGGTLLLNNIAAKGRGEFAAFFIDSNDNTLGGNKAIENRRSGFFTNASHTGNDLVANRGRDNKDDDLEDGNGNCLSNRWEGNKGTADPPCIKSANEIGDSAVPVTHGVTHNCGDTLPPGDYVLTSDFGPCTTINSLILDSARLDLRGFSVLGDGDSGDVRIIGTGSLLENGTVRDTDNGVQVAGTGSHIVRRVKSTSNNAEGFVVLSGDNILRNNAASNDGDSGFFVNTSDNLLTANTAVKTAADGFEVDELANGNRLWNNAATKNQSVGFRDSADTNTYVGNRSIGSFSVGFFIPGEDNRLFNNLASKTQLSGGGIGFQIPGNNNTLGSNKAIENKGNGFQTQAGTTGADFVSNRGKDNGGVDLVDGNGDCLSNRWEGNKGTRSPACIG